MSFVPSVDEAREMLKKFNEEEFHLKHGEIVSGVMGYFAKEHDPDHVDYWRVVGMLHDLDFEQYPEEHCIKQQELMKELVKCNGNAAIYDLGIEWATMQCKDLLDRGARAVHFYTMGKADNIREIIRKAF